jgi:hypothetical protein
MSKESEVVNWSVGLGTAEALEPPSLRQELAAESGRVAATCLCVSRASFSSLSTLRLILGAPREG